MAAVAALQRNAAFTGARSFRPAVPAKLKASGAVLRAPLARQQVKPQAFFGLGGGGGKAADSKFYICIDCGYIYDLSDPWSEVPSYYRCPKCNSPKSRFKVFKGEVKGKPGNSKGAMQQRMKDKAW